jgi:hypothetical protein
LQRSVQIERERDCSKTGATLSAARRTDGKQLRNAAGPEACTVRHDNEDLGASGVGDLGCE